MDTQADGPFYTRSTGVRLALTDMATPHLKSALAKLSRELPGHPEIPDMAAEVAKRDAEFAAKQAEFEQTGAVADHEVEEPF